MAELAWNELMPYILYQRANQVAWLDANPDDGWDYLAQARRRWKAAIVAQGLDPTDPTTLFAMISALDRLNDHAIDATDEGKLSEEQFDAFMRVGIHDGVCLVMLVDELGLAPKEDNVVISERELDDAVQLRIDPSMFDFLTQLAPGVVGYDVDHEGELWIPVIHAENPGAGDVGRYLDSLPTDRTVVVPNVINGQLAEMLERRGFQHAMKAIEDKDVEESLGEEAVEVWERAASTDPAPAMYDPDTMPKGARYLGADGA